MNDALLVTFLDGEATPDERAIVERAIASDERVRTKLDVLRRSRDALHEYLAGPVVAVAPPRARSNVLPWLAAAAALVVVVSIALSRRGADETPVASNDWLEVSAVAPDAAHPLFTNLRVSLVGHSKTSLPCRLVARQPGETDAQLTTRIAAEPAEPAYVPLVVDGEITLPDGSTRRGSFVRLEGTFPTEAGSRTAIPVELIDLVTPHPAINPWFTVGLTRDGTKEDFLDAFTRAGGAELGGEHGFVAEVPGRYRLRVSLRSFTPLDETRFVRFPKPLVVETAFEVSGVVGAWSAPKDGLSARIVGGTSSVGSEPWPFALQLRNDSDRPRAYNVAGTTLAKIPQPFHFDLIVDGERWEQRKNLPVIFSGYSSFLPQPVGTTRSVVVLDGFWRHGSETLAALRGKHTIALRFHFEPTLWDGDPRDLWQGEVETPPITIEVRDR